MRNPYQFPGSLFSGPTPVGLMPDGHASHNLALAEGSLLIRNLDRQEVDKFRDALDRCATAADTDRLCEHVRDALLVHGAKRHDKYPFMPSVVAGEFAAVMGVTSPAYDPSTAADTALLPPRTVEFRNMVEHGRSQAQRCRVSLRMNAGGSEPWLPTSGADDINSDTLARHYQWARHGVAYCDLVKRAWGKIKTWDEARTKLNQLILYRHLLLSVSNSVKVGVNSVTQNDLKCLAEWIGGGLYAAGKGRLARSLCPDPLDAADLPAGFAFDRFGLLVRHTVVADVAESASDYRRVAEGQAASAQTPSAPIISHGIDDFVAAPGLSLPEAAQRRDANASSPSSHPSSHDRDNRFVEIVIADLERLTQHYIKAANTGDTLTFGRVNNELVCKVLHHAELPNTDHSSGRVEAHFLTPEEAQALVSTGPAPDAPIITSGKIFLPGSASGRPIEQLLQKHQLFDHKTVGVQIPSQLIASRASCKDIDFAEVVARFRANKPADDPWNLLEFGNPLQTPCVPSFLGHDNCGLLRDIRTKKTTNGVAGRPRLGLKDGWTEIEEWVLLSEGGNVTGPHTDSYGYATWITVQEGEIGFGYLSHPDKATMDRWTEGTAEYVDGNWRYVVLRPGQTVFFNTGTVHFVFRPRGVQTMAFGGHVLLWSYAVQWLETVIWQLEHDDVTNETMLDSEKYVVPAFELVKRRREIDDTDIMGGDERAEQFLALKKVCGTYCFGPGAASCTDAARSAV